MSDGLVNGEYPLEVSVRELSAGANEIRFSGVQGPRGVGVLGCRAFGFSIKGLVPRHLP